jgi:hypothetical protein
MPASRREIVASSNVGLQKVDARDGLAIDWVGLTRQTA